MRDESECGVNDMFCFTFGGLWQSRSFELVLASSFVYLTVCAYLAVVVILKWWAGKEKDSKWKVLGCC